MSLELLRATVAWTCSERSLDDPVGFAGDRLVTVGTSRRLVLLRRLTGE